MANPLISKKSNAAISVRVTKNMWQFAGINDSIRGIKMIIYKALIMSKTLLSPKPKNKLDIIRTVVSVFELSAYILMLS